MFIKLILIGIKTTENMKLTEILIECAYNFKVNFERNNSRYNVHLDCGKFLVENVL